MPSVTIDANALGRGLLPFGEIRSPYLFRSDILGRLAELGIDGHDHFVLRDDTLDRQGRASILKPDGPWFLEEGHHYSVLLRTQSFRYSLSSRVTFILQRALVMTSLQSWKRTNN